MPSEKFFAQISRERVMKSAIENHLESFKHYSKILDIINIILEGSSFLKGAFD